MFCPHCGARLGDRPDLAGQWFSCPTCAAPFQVPVPPPQSVLQSPADPARQAGPTQAAPQPSVPLKAILVKQAVAVAPASTKPAVATAQQPTAQVATARATTQVATAQPQSAPTYFAQPHTAQPHAPQPQPAPPHAVPPNAAAQTAPLKTVAAAAPAPAPSVARHHHRRPAAPIAKHPTDGLAIVGLGLGLVGLPLGLAPYYGFVVSGFGAAMGAVAVVAAISLRKPGGLAVAALAVSGIGLCFQVSMWNLHWREKPGEPLAEVANLKPPSPAGPKAGATPTATATATPMATQSATPTTTVGATSAKPPAAYEPWQELRIWTIGDKPVSARLKGWRNERALLELDDGTTLNTSQSALSEADRKWAAAALGK